ncbi:MAG: phosphatase PAP2 family protein [Microthrixaceae bacterium]
MDEPSTLPLPGTGEPVGVAVEPRSTGLIPVPAWVDHLDGTVDSWWDRLRGHDPVDRAVFGLTEAANHSVLWIVLGAGQALPRDDRWKRMARFAGTLGLESALVNGPLKALVLRPRPVPRFNEWSLRTPRTSSFPSGHSSAAFCAAVLLSDDSDVPTPVWFGLAGAVALSRVHVGIHWMVDTLGGGLIGYAMGKAALKLVPLEPRRSGADEPEPADRDVA